MDPREGNGRARELGARSRRRCSRRSTDGSGTHPRTALWCRGRTALVEGGCSVSCGPLPRELRLDPCARLRERAVRIRTEEPRPQQLLLGLRRERDRLLHEAVHRGAVALAGDLVPEVLEPGEAGAALLLEPALVGGGRGRELQGGDAFAHRSPRRLPSPRSLAFASEGDFSFTRAYANSRLASIWISHAERRRPFAASKRLRLSSSAAPSASRTRRNASFGSMPSASPTCS